MFIRKYFIFALTVVSFISCGARTRMSTIPAMPNYDGAGYFQTDLYSMSQLYALITNSFDNFIPDSTAFKKMKDYFEGSEILTKSTIEPRFSNVKLLVKELNKSGYTVFTFTDITFGDIYSSFNIPVLIFAVTIDLEPKTLTSVGSVTDINLIDSTLFYYRDQIKIRILKRYRQLDKTNLCKIETDDNILFTGVYSDNFKGCVAEDSEFFVKPMFLFFVSTLPEYEINEYDKERRQHSISAVSGKIVFLKGEEQW